MKRIINFLKLRFLMIAISLLLIAAGITGYFLRGGLNFGIDYTAGLVQQIKIDPFAEQVDIADLRNALSEIEGVSLQVVGRPSEQQFTIKVIAPEEDLLNCWATPLGWRTSKSRPAISSDRVIPESSPGRPYRSSWWPCC
jgi:preprotein translocase subunit SecF